MRITLPLSSGFRWNVHALCRGQFWLDRVSLRPCSSLSLESKQLRDLERDGIITRKQFNEISAAG